MGNNKAAQVQKLNAAQRRARAVELRAMGATLKAIADELGVSEVSVWRYIHKELDRLAKSSEQDARLVRQLELEKCDRLERFANLVLTSEHPLVHRGEIVVDTTRKDKEGNHPRLQDAGPKLAAIDRLNAIAARRERLLGLSPLRLVGGDGEPLIPDYAVRFDAKIELIAQRLEAERARAAN